MTPQVKSSARDARRLQTRERILGAAIAEFKRSGMTGAEVNAIVAAAGVAHGTFFFHFPSKEHVLLELESREEARIAAEFARFLDSPHDMVSALTEVVDLVTDLEQRFGPAALQRNTRPALLADPAPQGRVDRSSGHRPAGPRDRAGARRRRGASGSGRVLQRDILPSRHLRRADHYRTAPAPATPCWRSWSPPPYAVWRSDDFNEATSRNEEV